LAAGLSGLFAAWSSGIDNSSTASSFSFSSYSSSSDLISRERGVGIIGVVTARGDAALLFLFVFFCSTAFTAEIAAATAKADFFATVDLVLRRDIAARAAGSAPSLCVSVFVGLHQRVRLIIL
jgi:hypothetical protein